MREHFPQVQIVQLEENFGFCGAVNRGICQANSPYVLLLNNDTQSDENFVREMVAAMERHPRAFSCGAKLLQYRNRNLVDDAGNYYNALGWAFARGKDRESQEYEEEEKIFAACAGAAIYRKKIFQKIGMFDEEHFAYLEDTDIGYRARLYGYENWFAPKAVVYHVGSGTTGSRYNEFKIRYSSRNNIYMLYKNMPAPQIILNFPLLAAGFGAKLLFFYPERLWQGVCGWHQKWFSAVQERKKSSIYFEKNPKMRKNPNGIVEKHPPRFLSKIMGLYD